LNVLLSSRPSLRDRVRGPVRPAPAWPRPRRNAVEARPACVADVYAIVRREGAVFWATLTERLTYQWRADAVRLAIRHLERHGAVRVVSVDDDAIGFLGCRRRVVTVAPRKEAT
jgi:hypothetical protein